MKQYDLHVHTNASCCSPISPEKVLNISKKRGLDGIAITDHNTIKGALRVKNLNKDKNFEVIIGEEISTDKGHILCLYVKKEIKKGKREDVIKEAKKQGCIIIAAHPFDSFRNNFRNTIPKDINAIECYNGRSLLQRFNKKAASRCKKQGLAEVGGSDSHLWIEVGRVRTFFEGDLRKAIKNRNTTYKGTNIFGFIGIAVTTLYLLKNKLKKMCACSKGSKY